MKRLFFLGLCAALFAGVILLTARESTIHRYQGRPNPQEESPLHQEESPLHNGAESNEPSGSEAGGGPHRTVRLYGTTRNAGGDSLPATTVLAIRISRPGQATSGVRSRTVTDERGTFELGLKPGLYILTAKWGDLRSERFETKLVSDRHHDFYLAMAGARLSIHIRSAHDGLALEEFSVFSNFVDGRGRFDEFGKFAIRALKIGDVCGIVLIPPENVFLSGVPLKPHQVGGERYEFEIPIHQPDELVTLRASHFATVAGVVRGPPDTPLYHLRVYGRTGRFQVVKNTRDRGEFASGGAPYKLRLLPGHDVTLYAGPAGSKEGFFGMLEPRGIGALAPDETRNVDLELVSLWARIHGRIATSTGRTPRVLVHASLAIRVGGGQEPFYSSRIVKCDASGHFDFKGLPPSTVTLLVELTDEPSLAMPLPIRFDLGRAEVRDLGTMLITPGGSVSGRVLDSMNLPCAKAAVHAVPILDGKPALLCKATVRTNKDGHYRFEHLSTGRYNLHAGDLRVVSYTVDVREELAARANLRRLSR